MCDHTRFRKPSKEVPMGMMYFESYACISLIVHPPFGFPGSAPGSYQGPKTFWTGERGVKSSQTQTNSTNGTVHHLQKEG